MRPACGYSIRHKSQNMASKMFSMPWAVRVLGVHAPSLCLVSSFWVLHYSWWMLWILATIPTLVLSEDGSSPENVRQNFVKVAFRDCEQLLTLHPYHARTVQSRGYLHPLRVPGNVMTGAACLENNLSKQPGPPCAQQYVPTTPWPGAPPNVQLCDVCRVVWPVETLHVPCRRASCLVM